MRRLGLLLLILLLTLRVWAGDAMAWSMPAAGTATAPAPTLPCHEHGAVADHGGPASHATAVDDSGNADTTGAGSCGICQVCHSPCLSTVSLVPQATPAPQASRAWRPARFKSLSLPPQLKPPIG